MVVVSCKQFAYFDSPMCRIYLPIPSVSSIAASAHTVVLVGVLCVFMAGRPID